MANPDLTIKIDATALEYAEQKFWKWFGKDVESKQLAEWFKGLHQTALVQTSTVHCVGMRNPLPFDSIYQPNRVLLTPDEDETSPTEPYTWDGKVTRSTLASRSILRGRAFNVEPTTVAEFLRRDQDALIRGGPGWGKTTFLHHIFRLKVNDEDTLPVLITLRRPSAVDDLECYVNACSRIQKKQHRVCTLLLVDGYDEISTEQRKRVAEALLRFQALRAGKFYLTCRDYYLASQITAPEVRLDEFSPENQVRFVQVFLSKFSVITQDAETVINQLKERGLAEFLSHPLLLTLACIVRASSTTSQPRSALRLLEHALNVLCFQWDEQKDLDRQRATPMDGHERKRILKHIAYKAKSPFVKGYRAEEIARTQLTLLGWDRVDPRVALLEIARFYGILVPAEDGYEFVHRTIHDFLAAQQWVESGEFAKQSTYEWSARTAYATCLVEDATDILKQALAAPDGLAAITEIIGNHATFRNTAIAEALIDYFSAPGRVHQYERGSYDETHGKYSPRIFGQLDSDFIRLANTRFLDFIVEYCCERTSPAADLLVAYAVTELFERRLKLSHQTYNKALAAYKTDLFTFVVPGTKQAKLDFLNPVLQNRTKDYKPGSTV
jgi:hypothetical protein